MYIEETWSELRCETPESPPGDYNYDLHYVFLLYHLYRGVKHLNPRQGITTLAVLQVPVGDNRLRVKHLNPRQGITTHPCTMVVRHSPSLGSCETPESPPGDYNRMTSWSLQGVYT